MPIITDTQALSEFCDRLRGAEFITVDTEFMREKTYWPILCLVQVAGPDEVANEMITHLGPKGRDALLALCNASWARAEIPGA